MSENRKKKVLMYYSYGNRVGGPLTYINTVMNSNLREQYEFVTCYQNMAAGGINYKLLLKMKNTIKHEQPDIVHVHGLQSEGLYGVLAAKMAGCKCIVTTVHGFAFDSQSSSKFKRLLYRYCVEPITLRLSDKVYCVCRYASKRKIILKNTKKNNLGCIPNPAPTLVPCESRENIRKKLNIHTGEIAFVISGRICVEKGFDVLSDIIKLLNIKQKEKFKLIVIGEGEYSDKFSKAMKREIEQGQVIMVGRTNKVADYLNASDICIFPSYHENMPIALLEAGKLGVPCIASDVGGIPEIICNGKTGFLIHGWNPEDYVEKMELLINNSALLNEMKENIKQDIDERFSVDEMCEKLQGVYECQSPI